MAKKKAAKAPPAVRRPKQETAVEQAIDRIAWQKQIADELGYTVETIREWSLRPGFPKLGTAEQVIAWKQAHVRAGGPPTRRQRETGDFDPFSAEAQLEQLAEKARNQVLKNEKLQEDIVSKRLANEFKRRGLIPRSAVESFLRKLISAARSEMEGWPSEVVTALPGRDREIASDILNEKVRLLLVRMASWEYEILVDEQVSGDGAQ